MSEKYGKAGWDHKREQLERIEAREMVEPMTPPSPPPAETLASKLREMMTKLASGPPIIRKGYPRMVSVHEDDNINVMSLLREAADTLEAQTQALAEAEHAAETIGDELAALQHRAVAYRERAEAAEAAEARIASLEQALWKLLNESAGFL